MENICFLKLYICTYINTELNIIDIDAYNSICRNIVIPTKIPIQYKGISTLAMVRQFVCFRQDFVT